MIGKLAAGTALILIVGACSGDVLESDPTGICSGQPATTEWSPRLGEALLVATAFIEAHSERDIDKLTANSVEGFISGLVVLSLAEMPAEFVWQEAVGWRMGIPGCEVTEPSESTPTIRCDVTHQNDISQALGVSPYPGSYHIKVRFEGEQWLGNSLASTVVTESHQAGFPILEFTVGTWRPFVKWVEETHPPEIDRMLGSTVPTDVEFMIVAGERDPLLGDEATALWRERTAELVATHSVD